MKKALLRSHLQRGGFARGWETASFREPFPALGSSPRPFPHGPGSATPPRRFSTAPSGQNTTPPAKGRRSEYLSRHDTELFPRVNHPPHSRGPRRSRRLRERAGRGKGAGARPLGGRRLRAAVGGGARGAGSVRSGPVWSGGRFGRCASALGWAEGWWWVPLLFFVLPLAAEGILRPRVRCGQRWGCSPPPPPASLQPGLVPSPSAHGGSSEGVLGSRVPRASLPRPGVGR